jgi:pyruvate carboxylase subunit B
MNGKVERILVKAGQAVAKGDVLFVLEAMKMQNEVRSPVAGTVQAVHAAAGAVVEPSQVLVEIA